MGGPEVLGWQFVVPERFQNHKSLESLTISINCKDKVYIVDSRSMSVAPFPSWRKLRQEKKGLQKRVGLGF